MIKIDWIEAARKLGCDVAAIRAVAEVEGGGVGFASVGGKAQPIILFEPHIFWRQLKQRGDDPALHVEGNSDVLYEKWKSRPYPSTQAERYRQLDKAAIINREAALSSASWGRFQVMGFNWQACACSSLQEFINRMYKNDDEQLTLFVNFIRSSGLADDLRRKDWTGFARVYNGPAYAVNGYHQKLKAAYDKYAASRH